MHKLKHIFTFIAPYVKPYWGRLLAGLFFGVLFGASNGLVLWATKTLWTGWTRRPSRQRRVERTRFPSPATGSLRLLPPSRRVSSARWIRGCRGWATT